MDAVSILNLEREELARWCQEHGHALYRADQVRRWIFQRRAASFAQMSDLPAALRAALEQHFRLLTTQVALRRQSADGTVKLLLHLADGRQVECVLMREDARRTVCLSTQVGCGMGCVFCASGLRGLMRNLTAGEILEQLLHLQQAMSPHERISHIVVMGMGEPLANLAALLPALETATAPAAQGGLGISGRRVTISTVGLPQRIHDLADGGAPYHLAVSLHAPDDALRNQLVAVSRQITMDEILQAADYYFRRTGRQVTFEYVLLRDVNDQPTHAQALAQLLAGRKAHVNLIPHNPVAELPYAAPSQQAVNRFATILRHGGVSVTVRKRKGSRIDAACGQLQLLEREGQRDKGPKDQRGRIVRDARSRMSPVIPLSL